MSARGVSALAGLLTVPIVLRYLGKEQYGLWAVVLSLSGWVAVLDFGLVAGLVNPISEAYGRDDRGAARAYFSTSFFALLGISVALGVLVAAFVPFIPLHRLLSIPGTISETVVRRSIGIGLLLFAAGLPLSAVQNVYVGSQKGYIASAFAGLASLLSVAILIVVVQLQGPLPAVVAAAGLASLVSAFASSAYLLIREMPWLTPRLADVSRNALRRVRRTSLPLYLFQLGALVVNQTQQVILTRVAGLSVVADYDVLWRVYVLAIGIVITSTQSFFPSFRETFERGEFEWMRRTFWRLVGLRMTLAAAFAVMLPIAGNLLFRLWLGRSGFQYGVSTWSLLGGFVVAAVWGSSFLELLMILDHIWPLVRLVLVQGAATVVLTAALGSRLGVSGGLLAIAIPTVAGALYSEWLARAVLRPAARPA